ncbi:AAA family ATPase [Litorilinea aerophila]|uniref:ATP-dependent RecD2 DNA helicase n=1 Tax=Litorilinea aerophila TaxID=1204385 RepID=A0A540VDP2_9CHLR|nr:AAA family ATPase [Litorilinea aerophila]MCC9077374.1 AAA family ATPase [Litorilinea aerophila]
METLRGVIERITYLNPENGYTVAKLTPEQRPRHLFGAEGEVTIVGNMASVNVGEFVELTGRWTIHPEYGKQFLVEGMRSVLPATVAGLEKYLGSGLIKGVGPVTARRIVRHFGLETLDVIEHQPTRLQEVPGVGRKRTRMIIQAWAEQRAIKEVMLFLQSHGVSTSLATKIYKHYGNDAIAIVQADPYRLARDIYGIGFLTADKIARSLGMAPDAPQRVAAGVAYTLNQATDEGHVFLPADELVQAAASLLEVSPQQAAAGLIQLWAWDQVKVSPSPGQEAPKPQEAAPAQPLPLLMAEAAAPYAVATPAQTQHLLQEKPAVYLTPLYFSEQGVASRLQRLLREGESRLPLFQRPDFDWEAAFRRFERQAAPGGPLHLAPQQREAVQAALTRRLVVLTGGPGTGKTTTVRAILWFCQQAGYQALLAAPTGRAAKRLAETTGHEARTVHRLLEFKPGEGMAFQRNEETPLAGHLLIVDEASMLDLVLTHHLLKAVPPGMHLLLVGDVDQLPSVGAGNVLQDIIGAVEAAHARAEGPPDSLLARHAQVVRLQTIFRQEPGSLIITNAHRINQGLMPIIDNQQATDFFLFKTDDPERAAQLCVELVQHRIPRRFGLTPADIQVLSPMHRGVVGVGALNQALQAALNPPGPDKPERILGNRIFRPGDRVMQVRNNYDKEVYNGDLGIITQVDLEMQQLTVMMDGRAVCYDFLELDELVHAFAISVHKSQGAEFPAVVIPLLTGHYMMLQRNLLYTAVTRARRLVVLVGQPKAIAMAVRNNRVTRRHTGLRTWLEQVD